MDVGDIRISKERLKSLDEIETKEQRALTMEENWEKLNVLFVLGKALGWKEDDIEVEIVRARWVRIKELYESGAFRSSKD